MAKDNLSDKALSLFLKKCKNLKDLLEKPVNVIVKTETIVTKEPVPTLLPYQSIADELKKLADLKDLGILTVEEFESQKKKFLSN